LICASGKPRKQLRRHEHALLLVVGQTGRWAKSSLKSPKKQSLQREGLREEVEEGSEMKQHCHLDRLRCQIRMTLDGARTVRGHVDRKGQHRAGTRKWIFAVFRRMGFLYWGGCWRLETPMQVRCTRQCSAVGLWWRQKTDSRGRRACKRVACSETK
jgi:hypothetical protein